MRDIIKNKAYFDKYVSTYYSLIKRNESKLRLGQIKPNRIKIVNGLLSGYYINILIAKYSRGDDMTTEIVINDYIKSVELISNSWEKNINLIPYEDHFLKQYSISGFLGVLRLLSLSVLLNIHEKNLTPLINYIDKDEVKDYLFEFLINHKQSNSNREIIQKESYKHFFGINELYHTLKEIVIEEIKGKAEQKIKFFLENEWYQSFKDTPLINQHKNPHNIYAGYWCFAAAAIVKIKDLDDSSFRDNQYYPKDLV